MRSIDIILQNLSEVFIQKIPLAGSLDETWKYILANHYGDELGVLKKFEVTPTEGNLLAARQVLINTADRNRGFALSLGFRADILRLKLHRRQQNKLVVPKGKRKIQKGGVFRPFPPSIDRRTRGFQPPHTEGRATPDRGGVLRDPIIRTGGAPKKKAAKKAKRPTAGATIKPVKKAAAKRAFKKAKKPTTGITIKPVKKALRLPSAKKAKAVPTSFTKVELYTRASMDKQILLNKVTPVKVDLSREKLEEIKEKLNAIAKGEVDIEIPLTISIHAIMNMRISGPEKFILDVPDEGQIKTVKFTVTPTHAGICKCSVEVWQDQVPVCSVDLLPDCVTKVTTKGITKAKVASPTVEPFPTEVIQLCIRERDMGAASYYDFELNAKKLGIASAIYVSPAIKIDRVQYVSDLYTEIERLWETVVDDPKQFAAELRNFGSELYDKLIPEGLQEVLYKNAGKIKSIQVISSEPFIPWELILIKNPDDNVPALEKNKFLGELGVIRWAQKWSPARSLSIRKNYSRYIIPTYLEEGWDLPAGVVEKKYLTKSFGAKELKADPNIIDKFIKKPGSFDLLHMCCHGDADPKRITYSNLRMLERETNQGLKPTYLTQLSIEHCGTISKNEDHRPIIVLNACRIGRSGNALSGFGGFANAFLKAGAGVFVGSHWQVEDKPAATFIKTFYDQLKKGKILSEAVIEARRAARKEKDATWISYVIYGHPFAKLLKP